MIRNIAKYGILTIIVVTIAALSFYSYQATEKNKQLSDFVKSQDGLIGYIAYNNSLQYTLQGSPFDNSQEFIPLKGNKIHLSDTIPNSAIVLYTGPSYCSDCVKNIMANFGDNFNTVPESKVIVLFDRCSARNLYEISLDFSIVNATLLGSESIILPEIIKARSTPFVFTVDNSGRFDNVFIPIKDNDNFNTKYYQAMISKMNWK